MSDTDFLFDLEDEDISGSLLLSKYRTVRKLAAGGMGVVYLARAEGAAGFVRPVVTKLILPGLASSKEFLGMFIREAHILANLREPGIVNVVDFAEERGCYVMVLDYVRGYELRDWLRFLLIRERKLPTPVALQIMLNVLDTLSCVHKATDPNGEPLGIVHRDISPSNVLIDTDGRTKILDFGIGLIAKGASSQTDFKTEVNTFKGKIAYAAPEMFDGAPASAITDVYAAAITLHELLLGKNEFLTSWHAQTLNRVLHHEPSMVHKVRDDVSPKLDDIIQKSLQKKPENRFQDAADFAAALRENLQISEREASEALTQLVQRDFPEELPKTLRCHTLKELDDSWLNPPDAIMQAAPAVPSEAPTDDDLPSAGTMSTAAKIFAGLAVLAVLAMLALVLFLFTDSGKGSEKKVYIVPSTPSTKVDNKSPDARVTSDQGPAKATPASSQAKAPIPPPKEAEPATPKAHKSQKRRAKRDKSNTLTSAFRKKTGSINRCVQANISDLPQNASLSVRFHLNAAGRVKKAQIVPEKLSPTALGRCIEKVATGTKFPRQENDVTIRIPLNISRD